ncbi:MAG: hypothetical protein K0Q49_234, partial [Haloplasmataceae bacterium]|nr:hypothetical protein [Haloplasmataceae bacterium]
TFRNVDILPDILGYILIFQGLSYVSNYHPKFNYARIVVLFISLFSFIELIPFIRVVFDINLPFLTYIYILYSNIYLVKIILIILYNYLLFTGIRDNAAKFGYNGLSKNSHKLWILMLFYCLVANLYYIPFINVIAFVLNEYNLYNIIVNVFAFIVLFFHLLVLPSASNDLED